jgi:hypothetical protein
VLTIARRYLENGTLASPLCKTFKETEKHTEVARREFLFQRHLAGIGDAVAIDSTI